MDIFVTFNYFMWILLLPLLATAMNIAPLLPEEYQYTIKHGDGAFGHSFMVPMRDGIELETIAWTTDPDFLRSYSDATIKPRKVVLDRTPYPLIEAFTESAPYTLLFGYVSVI